MCVVGGQGILGIIVEVSTTSDHRAKFLQVYQWSDVRFLVMHEQLGGLSLVGRRPHLGVVLTLLVRLHNILLSLQLY